MIVQYLTSLASRGRKPDVAVIIRLGTVELGHRVTRRKFSVRHPKRGEFEDFDAQRCSIPELKTMVLAFMRQHPVGQRFTTAEIEMGACGRPIYGQRAYQALEQLKNESLVLKRPLIDAASRITYHLPEPGECLHPLWHSNGTGYFHAGRMVYHCPLCDDVRPNHFPNSACPEGCTGHPTSVDMTIVVDTGPFTPAEATLEMLKLMSDEKSTWRIRRTVRPADGMTFRIEIDRTREPI